VGITRSSGGCWLSFAQDGLPQTSSPTNSTSQGPAGGLIDRLETSGLSFRQADPVDRRVKRVYLQAVARVSGKAPQGDGQFNAKIVTASSETAEITSDALLAMKRNLLRCGGNDVGR